MIYTTADLVNSIVTRGQFPDTTNTKTISSPANLLILATEELRLKVLPMILDIGSDYYVKSVDIPVVSGQAAYPLPTRAAGNVARSIRLVNGTSDMPFTSYDQDDLPPTTAATPLGYYFENNNIVLYPTPGVAGPVIRLRYFIRPNRLEQVSNCAQITSVNTGTNQVTCASLPSTWGVGTVLDWVAQVNPYAARSIDLVVTAISGTTLTFAALPSDGLALDYLALAEYTPLPQIPEELQPLLAQMVVVRVHDALGNAEAYKNAQAELKMLMTSAGTLLMPRDQSHPKKIVGKNWRRLTVIRGFLR